MRKYRNCDFCGERYIDEHSNMPELCTPCWLIPDHIPDDQVGNFYRLRKIEKSEHKKMLLLRQTNS